MTGFRPQHLSASSVALYTRCPAQFRRRYVERIVTPTTPAQAWGKAFHAALEALHRGEDAELRWLSAWDEAEAYLDQTNQPPLSAGKEHGFRLLKAYRNLGLDGVKGEPEKRFRLPFPSDGIPVPLLGFIDLAVPSERQYRDFKTTGGSYWNATKVALEPQVQAYGWAYQKLYHHRAERALWIIFSTQKPTVDVYETTPSPDGFRLFQIQAEATWLGITAGNFAGCGTCPELCKPPAAAKPFAGPAFDWSKAS